MEKDGFETEDQFISRLREKNLFIDSQDKYNSETRTLSIGHQGEENYLYSIVLSSADSEIIDGIVKLPTIIDHPERANMTLRIKTTATNQTVTIPISDATGLQINWDAKTDPDNFVDVSGSNPTHQYAVVKDDYEVQIKGTAVNGAVFGHLNLTYVNPNIIEIIYWGENGFTEFLSFGKGLEGNIPANILKQNTKLEDTLALFAQCKGLTGTIPESLFSNCPLITSVGATFSGCIGLTGAIPENLFINNTELIDFTQTFSYCTSLTSLPANLFANNTKATKFSWTFDNCNSLTGTAPDLWNRGNVTQFSACFKGCTGLSNYASIPTAWK